MIVSCSPDMLAWGRHTHAAAANRPPLLLQAELNNAKGPELEPDMLSQDMLRKYITYAKANRRPKLQNADYEKITQVSRRCTT